MRPADTDGLHRPLTRLPERNLDVLRAVAVLAVVADHVVRLVTDHIGPLTPDDLGTFGVYVFFVHTSLVLISSLERQLAEPNFAGAGDDARSGWVRKFYLRRACRIYPLAWVAIALLVVARVPTFVRSLAHASYHARPASTFVANLALMQNVIGKPDVLGVLWSLPLEVQMYLLLPAAFLIARRSLRGLVALALVGVVLSFMEWHVRLGGADVPVLWRLSLLEYLPCFSCGILAYAVLLRRRSHDARLPAWTLALTIPAACLAQTAATALGGHAWGWIGCLVVLGIVVGTRESGTNAVTRLSKTIATYSYGVYLLHTFAIYWAFITLGRAPMSVQFATFVALMIALPWVAFHLVERPGIQLGKWLASPPVIAGEPAAP